MSGVLSIIFLFYHLLLLSDFSSSFPLCTNNSEFLLLRESLIGSPDCIKRWSVLVVLVQFPNPCIVFNSFG